MYKNPRVVSFSRSNLILRPSSNGRLGRTRAGDVSSSKVVIYEFQLLFLSPPTHTHSAPRLRSQ